MKISKPNITSSLKSFGILTRAQSEKLGDKPFDFALDTHHGRKPITVSNLTTSETISPSSPPPTPTITSTQTLPPSTSSTFPSLTQPILFSIVTSSTSPSSPIIPSSTTTTTFGTIIGAIPVITRMAQRPWETRGDVNIRG